jgi:hypothetical protein
MKPLKQGKGDALVSDRCCPSKLQEFQGHFQKIHIMGPDIVVISASRETEGRRLMV